MKPKNRKRIRTIHLNKVVIALCFSFFTLGTFAQGIMVKGTVVDQDNTPLVGVTIVETGTTNGVTTDIDGNYSIQVQSEKSKLSFSFIGFTTQVIPVKGQSEINETLLEEAEKIDEVVVVGYGVQKKSDATGSIAQVKSDKLENVASPQLASALQGQTSGVYIMNRSGQAGGAVDVSIRGVTSLNGAGPLWVIDGVPGDAGSLNVNDIETVDIIKDGTAAAIYGVKAAGGVIMVTTKRGKGAKKPTINLNTYTGISNPWRLPQMLNSDQYGELKREQWDTTADNAYGFTTAYADSLKSIGQYVSTDWMKEMYKTGKVQNYDLNIAGATDISNYYIGFTCYKEDASFIDNTFDKYSLRLNSDYKITEWLKAGESLNLMYTQTNPVADGGRYIDNLFRTPPLMPVYDENNQPGGFGYVDYHALGDFDGGNPMATQLTEKRVENNYRVNGNVYLKASLFDGFSITGTFSGGISMSDNKTVNYPYFLTDKKNFASTDISIDFSRNWNMLANVYANYTKSFGVNSINVTAGYEASQYAGRNLWANGTEARYGLEVLDQTTIPRNAGGSENLGRSLSQFGRVTYNYNNKYFLQSIVRRDGSDKFGKENRYGVFPSVSGAWKISEEDFIKNIEAISFLKLRGGYGINGNDNIGQYLYSQYMVSAQAYPYGTYSTVHQNPSVRLSSRMPNPEIRWERSKQADMGIELGLWKNKLFFNLELYQKSVDQMLFYKSLPLSSGLGQQYNDEAVQVVNAGLITNNGIDFSVNYKDNFGDFTYSVSANISSFNWKVKELTDDKPLMSNGVLSSGTQVSRTEVGEPGGLFYGYHVDGIFQSQEEVDLYNNSARNIALENDPNANTNDIYYSTKGTAPGDLIYSDLDGDGKVTNLDRTIIGNPWPKATYGLQLTAAYKGFDLLISLSGIYKRDVFNTTRAQMYQFRSYDYSTTTLALERWTADKPSTTNFRISGNDPNFNLSRPSSWFVEDGSFLRLKNLQLGYTVPKQISRKAKIEKLRLYISGQNIFTLTKYTGFDPEFGIGSPTGAGVDGGTYPQAKTYLMGLQVSF